MPKDPGSLDPLAGCFRTQEAVATYSRWHRPEQRVSSYDLHKSLHCDQCRFYPRRLRQRRGLGRSFSVTNTCSHIWKWILGSASGTCVQHLLLSAVVAQALVTASVQLHAQEDDFEPPVVHGEPHQIEVRFLEERISGPPKFGYGRNRLERRWTFQDNGNIQELLIYDREEHPLTIVEYQTDDSGRVLQYVVKSASSGKVRERVSMEYGQHGRVISRFHVDSEGNQRWRIQMSYDKSGHLRQLVRSSPRMKSPMKVSFEYDNDGHLIQQKEYMGDMLVTTILQGWKDGHLYKRKTTSTDGRGVFQTEIRTDSMGRVVHERTQDPRRKVTIMERTYDDQGNLGKEEIRKLVPSSHEAMIEDRFTTVYTYIPNSDASGTDGSSSALPKTEQNDGTAGKD